MPALLSSRSIAAVLSLGLLLGPVVVPPAAWAQAEAQAEASAAGVSRVLLIPEVIAVMRDEGIEYGLSMESELFPGRGGTDWVRAVDLIYDAATMQRRFEGVLAAELGGDPALVAAIEGFFGTDRGQRILTLEVEARRALMDDAVEDAARARAEEMTAANDPRMAALRRFAEINDLVESNVMGALNANLAFYRGMQEGGAFGDDMTEEQMLSDVWAQEPDIRSETEDWLYPFLAMAYGPLSDDDLQAYTAFSETAEGRRMNAVLFAAFDAVFVAISRDLGRAAARQLLGQDI
ncbi:MAG TPA: hypothetical protein VLA78_14815 [Paracoccaceae bacterium]|nr:hypothetical protein [Paracoccaceae bacterium]